MNNLISKIRKNRPSSALLSVVLAAAILLSTFSGMFILADTSNKLWDGAPATGYEKGTGTKEDPFIVSTPAELLLTVTSTGLAGDGTQNYYKLANDIYVNDVTDPSWKAEADNNQWPVVSTSEAAMDTAFGGVFNGNGYKVFGLFVDKTFEAPAEGLDTSVATGLFPSVKDSAKISAVGVEKSYFALRNNAADANKAYAGYVGVIAGYAYLSTSTDPIVVDRCYSSADCYTAGVYCGMIAGLSTNKNKAIKLSNSYSTTTQGAFHNGVNGNRFILVSGGVNAAAAVMEYTFSNSGLAFTGCNSTSKANYCCNWVSGNGFAKKIPLADMQGEKAFEKMENLNAENAYRLTNTFPVLRVFDRTESGERIWDGTFAEPTVGEGTETAPYIINEASELAYVIKNGGKDKFYRLEKDIYLNDINKIDWTTGEADAGYTPNKWLSSTAAPTFDGTIDGNGHMVYGLYYEQLGTSKWEFTGSGLIPSVKQGSVATLKNIGLDNLYVNNTKAAGGLFGANAKGEIYAENCFVGENALLKGHIAGAFFAGSSGTVSFRNCYSLASVSTHGATTGDSYHGLYGDFYGPKAASVLENCYNGKGPLSTKKNAPSTRNNIFVTENPENGTSATLRTADKMQGLDALLNAEKMKGLGDAYTATTTYPILKLFAKASEGEQNKYWDGVSYYAPTKGDGSEEAPFEIENTYMLAYVIMTGGEGKYYKLTSDIYINETDKVDWATGTAKDGYKINSWFSSKDVPVFSGTIDGDGHMVYGLYVKVDGKKEWKNFVAAAGLIPNANGKQVNLLNLGIDKAYVSHPNIAGLFVGMASRELIQITSCFTGADTYLDSYDAGALVGCASGAVIAKGCYSLTKFNSDAHLYGIVGDLYRSSSATTEERSSFTACYVLGNFAKKSSVNATNCYANEATGTIVKVTEANMKGLDVFSNADKMPRLGAYRLYQATESFPILRIFSDDPVIDDPIGEEETIWNGNAAFFFAEGSGTKEDPYMISKGSELALLVESGGNGAYYKLKNDIYLNDVTEKLWYKSATNNAWYSDSAVNCNIDGDGHCVYGLWYPKDNPGAAAGLFPKFSKGEIKNLGVRYAHVYAERFAGGFIGSTARGGQKSLNQCFVDDTVQVGYTGSGNYGAGGLIGIVDSDGTSSSVYTVLIDNCYSKAVVTGASDQRVCGLLGTVWKSAIQVKNSYSDGVPAYHMGSGGTVSSLYWNYANGTYVEGAEGIRDINEVLSGVYTTKGKDAVPNNFNFVTAEEIRGLGAAEKMPALDFTSVWQAVEKGTPVLRIFGLKGDDIDISEDGVTYASGSGRKNDPYIIKTAEQLRYLVLSDNTQGKYYKLGNDIYVNDTSKAGWMQNSPAKWYSYEAYKGVYFKGTLDGDGYSVYGIYINDTPETGETIINGSAGLFPNASIGATVKNLHLRDSYISGKAYAGGIIGYVTGTSAGQYITLIGCSADETVTVKGQTAGGLIGGGSALTEVQYAYFTGKIEATSEGRGNAIVGDIWKKGHRAAQAYTIGYTNYRGSFYPDIAFDMYSTVSQTKAIAVSANGMYGAAAKKNMPGLNWDVWYTVNGSTPHLKVITDDMILSYSSEGKKGEVWSGFMATKFAGGSGTEEDPYLIETPEQMAYLVMNLSGTQGKFYKITADLKFNDTSKEGWEAKATEWYAPGGSFRGHLDGDGHIVSGLYYNSVNSIVGLFPRISADAVIEKLGITESTIISTSEGGSQSFAAALSGYISGISSKEDTLETYKLPVVSQCFADDSVYVEAMFAGGLICGNQRGVRMDNCYFTGELTGEKYAGTLVGNSWNGWASYITDCYAVSKDYDPIATGSVTFFNYDGCYADGSTTKTPLVTKVTANRMKGELAKEHMPLLDYNKLWKTVKDGTPVLRCFKNAEKYSSHRDGKLTELSFATEGGDKMEAIKGYSGDPIPEIKDPVRYGFDFAGWYVNKYKVLPFELEFFPDNDMVIYADWVQRGFTQGFEDVADPTYDFNEGTENFRPGSKGYNPRYIHGGMKNMCSIPDSAVESIFLLNYKNPLEIGKEYDVNFWVFVKNEEPTGTVQFLHALHPQYDSPFVGYEEVIDLSEAKTGVWVEYRATIIANAPYLLIKTAQGNEVYYDDFQVVPTGEEGEVGKIDGFNPQGISGEPDLFGDVLGFVLGFGTIGIVVLVAAAVLGVAVVAAVVILVVTLLRKKAKKNKK